MTRTAIAEAAATATYKDLEPMLHNLCYKICPEGGDHEEYMSVAHLAYAKAEARFDPERSTFVTWIYTQVMYNLMMFRRRGAVRNSILHHVPDDHLERHPNRPSSHLEQVLTDCSDDAKLLVAIILQAPDEVAKILRRRTGKRIQSGLYKWMRDLGWSLGRVTECFDEIREALRS